MDGLIIKPKWADLILTGQKTWEIRGSRTNKRGTIGIIKSGTGKVFGTVELTDCIRCTVRRFLAYGDEHCIEDPKQHFITTKRLNNYNYAISEFDFGTGAPTKKNYWKIC